jgi:hypothetical protein
VAPVESPKQKSAVKKEPKSAEPIANNKMKASLYNSVETPEQMIARPHSEPVESMVKTKISIKMNDSSESLAILQFGPVPSTIKPKKTIEGEDVGEKPKVKPQEVLDGSLEEEIAADKEVV